jgi:hypothetical protein
MRMAPTHTHISTWFLRVSNSKLADYLALTAPNALSNLKAKFKSLLKSKKPAADKPAATETTAAKPTETAAAAAPAAAVSNPFSMSSLVMI